MLAGAPPRRLDLVPQGVEAGEIERVERLPARRRQRLHRLEPGAELGRGRPQRRLRVEVEVPGHVDDGEQQVARARRRARSGSPATAASSPASSAILGRAPSTSGQSKPTAAALRCTLAA